MLDLILFVADERLEKNDFLGIFRILNCKGDFECLFKISIFIVTLGKVEFIFSDLGVEFRKLFIDSG